MPVGVGGLIYGADSEVEGRVQVAPTPSRQRGREENRVRSIFLQHTRTGVSGAKESRHSQPPPSPDYPSLPEHPSAPATPPPNDPPFPQPAEQPSPPYSAKPPFEDPHTQHLTQTPFKSRRTPETPERTQNTHSPLTPKSDLGIQLKLKTPKQPSKTLHQNHSKPKSQPPATQKSHQPRRSNTAVSAPSQIRERPKPYSKLASQSTHELQLAQTPNPPRTSHRHLPKPSKQSPPNPHTSIQIPNSQTISLQPAKYPPSPLKPRLRPAFHNYIQCM